MQSDNAEAGPMRVDPRALRWSLVASLSCVAGLIALVIAVSSVPTIVGPDGSMYAAIATALIHGSGLAFPDGLPVTERPPLFSVVVAVLGATTGDVVGSAVVVSKVGFVAAAAIGAGLATRLSGIVGGIVVIALVVATPLFVRWTGATLLDGVAGALALLAIAAATEAGVSTRRWALVGLLLGASFLAKETAVLLFLVPLAVLLLEAGPVRARVDAALAATGAFLLVILPWLAWVAMQTGKLYLSGIPASIGLIGLVTAVIVALALRVRIDPMSPDLGPLARAAAFAALTSIWLIGATYVTERAADTDVVGSPIRALYRYGRLTLLPDLPLLLVGAAATAVGFLIALRLARTRAVAIGFLAGLPILLFVAQRGWEARSALLTLLLGSVLAAIAVNAALRLVATRRPRGALALGLVGLVIVIGGTIGPMRAALDSQARRAGLVTWDLPAVAELASWLTDRTSPGDTVVMSWQYAAMVYVRADGAVRVQQVPLVRISPTGDAAAPFDTVATFDAWEDHRLDARPLGEAVYLSDVRSADPGAALQRDRLVEVLDATRTAYLVVVEGGPVERSGENYPWIGEALGSGTPLRSETADASGAMLVFGVTHPVTYASGLVSMDPGTAAVLMAGDAAADRVALDAIGATAVRIWPAVGLEPAVLDDLRAAGRTVDVVDGQAGGS